MTLALACFAAGWLVRGALMSQPKFRTGVIRSRQLIRIYRDQGTK